MLLLQGPVWKPADRDIARFLGRNDIAFEPVSHAEMYPVCCRESAA
jgi:hypothetical protein